MIDLIKLTDARMMYERAFLLRGLIISDIEERFSERELLFSGNVIVLNDGNRRLQISVDEEAVPCAFIKKVGVDDEGTLLQIVVSDDDLLIDECSALVASWLTNEDEGCAVMRLASKFPGAELTR